MDGFAVGEWAGMQEPLPIYIKQNVFLAQALLPMNIVAVLQRKNTLSLLKDFCRVLFDFQPVIAQAPDKREFAHAHPALQHHLTGDQITVSVGGMAFVRCQGKELELHPAGTDRRLVESIDFSGFAKHIAKNQHSFADTLSNGGNDFFQFPRLSILAGRKVFGKIPTDFDDTSQVRAGIVVTQQMAVAKIFFRDHNFIPNAVP